MVHAPRRQLPHVEPSSVLCAHTGMLFNVPYPNHRHLPVYCCSAVPATKRQLHPLRWLLRPHTINYTSSSLLPTVLSTANSWPSSGCKTMYGREGRHLCKSALHPSSCILPCNQHQEFKTGTAEAILPASAMHNIAYIVQDPPRQCHTKLVITIVMDAHKQRLPTACSY